MRHPNTLPGSTTLGYTSAPSDPSGLIYLNARFYNPSIGSFQSHDPLEGSPGSPVRAFGTFVKIIREHTSVHPYSRLAFDVSILVGW